MTNRSRKTRFGAILALVLAGLLATACGGSPTEPELATIRFSSGSNLRLCAVGTIRLYIDGSQVGTMRTGESRSFPVTPGSHSVRATDSSGSWGPATLVVGGGETREYSLGC